MINKKNRIQRIARQYHLGFYQPKWGQIAGVLILACLPGLMIFSMMARASEPSSHTLGDAFYRQLHQREFVLHRQRVDGSYTQLRQDAIRALNSSTSNILRKTGQKAFGSRFRLRSNLGWDIDKSLRADVDVGLHRLTKYRDTSLGIQAGLIYWQGHREADRLDISGGLVLRRYVGKTKRIILGLNSFYDHNVEDGLGRLGVGFDAQMRSITLAINGYIPLSTSWEQESATSLYERRLVAGADAQLRIDWGKRLATTATLGYWQKAQSETDKNSNEWQLSAQSIIDVYVHPNAALRVQYDYGSYNIDDQSDILVGLQLRWPTHTFDTKTHKLDLYQLVEREKRLLYSERKTQPKLQAVKPEVQAHAVVNESHGDLALTMEMTAAIPTNVPGNPALIATLTNQSATTPLSPQQDGSTRVLARPAEDFRSGHYNIPLPKGRINFTHIIPDVIIDDEEDEPAETFYVILNPDEDAKALGLASEPIVITVTINESDARPQRLSIRTHNVPEADTDINVIIDIQLDLSAYEIEHLPKKDHIFDIAIKPDNSTAGAQDYSVPSTFTIAAGKTTGSFALTIKGDKLAEGNERFSIVINYPDDFPYAQHRSEAHQLAHEFIIMDNDAPASLALIPIDNSQPEPTPNNSVRIKEGQRGEYRYALKRPDGTLVQSTAQLNFTLEPVEGISGYVLGATQFSIAAEGYQSDKFVIAVVDEVGTTEDSNVTVPMRLLIEAPPPWLSTDVLSTTLIMIDNDGLPRLQLANRLPTRRKADVLAGDLGLLFDEPTINSQQVKIPLALHRSISGQHLQFDIRTQDDSAIAGRDYTAISTTTVTIANGHMTPTPQSGIIDSDGNLLITLLGDRLAESTERFTLQLTNFRVASGQLSDIYNGATNITVVIDIVANDIITQLVAVNNAGTPIPTIQISENAGTADIYYELRDATGAAVQTQSEIRISIAELAIVGRPIRDTHYRVSTNSLRIAPNASRSGKTTVTGLEDSSLRPSSFLERIFALEATPSIATAATWYNIASNHKARSDITLTNITKPILYIGFIPFPADKTTSAGVVAEGGTAKIAIYLNSQLPRDFSMRVRTRDGTATSPDDYTAIDTTLTIPAGQLRMTTPRPGLVNAQGALLLEIVDDDLREGRESLTLHFDSFAVTNRVLADVYAGATDITMTINIHANDTGPRPSLLIDNVPYPKTKTTGSKTVSEGGTTPIALALDMASSADITMRVRTRDGTATSPDDYTAINTTLTIPARQTKMTVARTGLVDTQGNLLLQIIEDYVKEDAETFTLQFDNFAVAGQTLAQGFDGATDITLTITIASNENVNKPFLWIGNIAYANGKTTSSGGAIEGGTVRISLYLGAPLPNDLSMRIRTQNGTASSPADYVGFNQTISFAAGKQIATSPVPGVLSEHGAILLNIKADTIAEGDETFTIYFDNFQLANRNVRDFLDYTTALSLSMTIYDVPSVTQIVAISDNEKISSALRIREGLVSNNIYFQLRDSNNKPLALPQDLTINISGQPHNNPPLGESAPAQDYTISATRVTIPANATTSAAFTITHRAGRNRNLSARTALLAIAVQLRNPRVLIVTGTPASYSGPAAGYSLGSDYSISFTVDLLPNVEIRQ